MKIIAIEQGASRELRGRQGVIFDYIIIRTGIGGRKEGKRGGIRLDPEKVCEFFRISSYILQGMRAAQYQLILPSHEY